MTMYKAVPAPIVGSPSVISEVLSGKRRLTLAHITQLATYFGLPAEVFLRAGACQVPVSLLVRETEPSREVIQPLVASSDEAAFQCRPWRIGEGSMATAPPCVRRFRYATVCRVAIPAMYDMAGGDGRPTLSWQGCAHMQTEPPQPRNQSNRNSRPRQRKPHQRPSPPRLCPLSHVASARR